MTLHQLHRIKRRLLARSHSAPLELHVQDLVLTLWLMGWLGLPTAMLLGAPVCVLACGAGCLAPSGYVRLRMLLHRRRVLRCDWLDPVPAAAPAPQR